MYFTRSIQLVSNAVNVYSHPQVLVAFALVQLFGQQHVPRLLEAVNRNMLATFLLANVLTGLINLLTDTLGTADWPARLTVAGYMAVLSVFAELLSGSIPTY